MPQVVEHLAELTSFRDRDILDVTLASALKDLLRPTVVAIHRCVGEPGRQRWLTRARLGEKDVAATADPLWTEIESLPRLEDHAERLECLRGERMLAVNGDTSTTYFPLVSERDAVGVVEVQTPRPLKDSQQRLVGSVLRVYRNFQGLLDYSERDTLTGLLNRKTFDESFLRIVVPDAAEAVSSEPLRRLNNRASTWLGVIDIDHFKRVNDGFGHLIGDEVLLLLSRLMRSSFRFHDHLFRFGGEEFVVLMRCGNGTDAEAAFERFRANVEGYVFPRVGKITVSVGFSEVRSGDSPSAAFERADKAVYYVKQNGRNSVCDHAELIASGKLADEAHDGDVELF